jgi:hypothetical protein
MTFCGRELTRTGVRPDSRQTEAMKKMPPPTDRKGVQRLLGFAQDLAKFCPNFSEENSTNSRINAMGKRFLLATGNAWSRV